MRAITVCLALIFSFLTVQEVMAAPAKTSAKKAKGKGAKLMARADTSTKIDTAKKQDSLHVKKIDTLTVPDSATVRLDSLRSAVSGCLLRLQSCDSAVAVERQHGQVLSKTLDSTKRVASDYLVQLTRQKDSLRILDSLRKATAPDSNYVLFLPVSYDTAKHPEDSTLARELTKTLFQSGVLYGKLELWEPKGNERRCAQPECWSTIARRKGAGQVLTGILRYSGDTLIYSAWTTSLVTSSITRQSEVVGYHREADQVPRFSRMAASQLFGIKDSESESTHRESPLWRRVLLLGVFAAFAGTVVALSW